MTIVKPKSAMKVSFCQHYSVDLVARTAAEKAGYSVKTARTKASELLQEPECRAYIDHLLEKKAKRIGIDASDVLEGIKNVTETCISTGEHSQALKGFELMGRHLKLFTDVQEQKHSFMQMGRVLMGEEGEQKALTFNVGSDVIEHEPSE